MAFPLVMHQFFVIPIRIGFHFLHEIEKQWNVMQRLKCMAFHGLCKLKENHLAENKGAFFKPHVYHAAR